VRKQSSQWNAGQPGVMSLVAFAVIVIAIWQASSFVFDVDGPADAVLYWFFTLTNIVRMLPFLLLISAVSCLCLTSVLALFVSRALNRRAWSTLVRNLTRGHHEATNPRFPPIQGVDLVSLPFASQPILPNAIVEGTDWTSPYSPYRYAHWVALHEELREFMFELEIGPAIAIRFWVPHKPRSDDELKILCSSLQTSYGTADFTETRSTTIPAILGAPETAFTFGKGVASFGTESVSVILINGIPGVDSEGAHLDRLIRALTELEIRASFVVHCSRVGNRLLRLTSRGQNVRLDGNPLRSTPFNRQGFAAQTIDERVLGSWRVSAYLVVRTKGAERHLSKVKSAKIALETTFLNPAKPIKTTVLTGQSLRKAMVTVLRRGALGKTKVLSSRQVSLLVHLPQQAQPGVFRKYSAEFEVPPEKRSEIVLFSAMKNDRALYPVGIDLSHLTTHMVVVGQTGKGKTHFVGNLLRQIQEYPDVGITILDWKGEYRSLVRTVYAVGTEDCPLRINLFETHGMANVEEYVQDLVSLLRELMAANVESSLSTQMERILRESLVDYLKKGPGNYEGYEVFLNNWVRTHEERFSQPESSIAGLINRFGGLFRGRLGRVFNTQTTTRDLSQLLRDHVCFDLSRLAAYSKEDARLFLNTLLMVLRGYLFKESCDRLRYLVVAEEAQYLVPEVFAKRSTAEASPAEDIALFQRAFGVGLVAISTRPSLISRNILANSGCKILFQCPLDSDLLGDIANLSSEQRQYLSQMPDRVVLAQLPWFEHPFKAHTEDFQFPERQETPSPLQIRLQAQEALPHVTNNRRVGLVTHSQANTIGPLVRHFLDLTCTALYNQGILHRILRIGDATAIDIPKHRTILLLIEDRKTLNELDGQNLSELASVVVLVCPPRLKSVILEGQNKRTDERLNDVFTGRPAVVISLTHNDLQRLVRQIKTGQMLPSQVAA
jgi:hypothetical protein